MPVPRWYWGAVVRVDEARELLEAVGGCVDGDRVRAQDPSTGHVTLVYAPLRDSEGAAQLVERVRDHVARIAPFDLRCAGFGEFPSDTRPVAWLAIAEGEPSLGMLRDVLCGCDDDCHRHDFVPHLTLAYGEDAAAYAEVRAAIRDAAEHTSTTSHVDAIWIAGFPEDGHPARDLRYVERIPLAGG